MWRILSDFASALAGLTANRLVKTDANKQLETPAALTTDQSLSTASTIASKQTTAAGIGLDHNSATGNFTGSLSPANLTASRRYTFPDATGTVPLLSMAQTWTALQTYGDNNFIIVGSSDATKTLKFEVDAQSAGADLTINTGAQTTDRTLSIPVLTGDRTLAVIDQAQTFTALPQFNSGININGGSYAAGTIYTDAVAGLVISGRTGSVYDFTLLDPTGSSIFYVPTGTKQIVVGTDPGGSDLLRVGGNGKFSGLVEWGNGTIRGMATYGTYPVIGSQSNHNLGFITNGQTRGYFDTSGVLIIGADPGGFSGIRTNSNIFIGAASSGAAQIALSGNAVSESVSLIVQQDASNHGFLFNKSNAPIYFGTNNSTRGYVTAGGDWIFGTDPGGSQLVRVGGAIRINSTTMIATSTAFTDGAGAASGTLTNAPAAGNPTKWIPIDDNGTTRYIPSW